MRSSKSRSRNKNTNRNRSTGNNMNRVFDSTGPEGKVRGTPQQIIEKYSQLARDAHLGNDRVAAENFLQHSEHYTRVFAEAQREIDARREQQEREHRERQQARTDQPRHDNQQNSDQSRDEQRHSDQDHSDQPRADQPHVDPRHRDQGQQNPAPVADLSISEQPDVVVPITAESDSGIVETPEQAPVKRRTRKPKATPVAESVSEPTPDEPKVAE